LTSSGTFRCEMTGPEKTIPRSETAAPARAITASTVCTATESPFRSPAPKAFETTATVPTVTEFAITMKMKYAW
jgi:hypothetical protein